MGDCFITSALFWFRIVYIKAEKAGVSIKMPISRSRDGDTWEMRLPNRLMRIHGMHDQHKRRQPISREKLFGNAIRYHVVRRDTIHL